MRRMRGVWASWLAVVVLGCGGGGGSDAADAGDGTVPDVVPDIAAAPDVPGIDVVEGPDIVVLPDVPPDGGADTAPPEDAVDPLPRTPGGLPLALPFELTRPDEGEPLTGAEITDFTGQLTGLWKQIDFFTWVYETTHGVDVSTGYPPYLIWWHDVVAVKDGDTVTFRNSARDGGSHNNAEPTSLVLMQAIGGYLLTGDESAGRIVEQFTNSFTAVMKGFVYDGDDPIEHLMSRNIVFRNHEFVLPSGKQKAVDYTEWYFPYEGWNADRFRYENNPTWGDIWVTNKRSKDDVPYLYRVAAWLPYVIELTDDPAIRAAAEEALRLMVATARDIVDHGYVIRTKDAEGNAVFVEDQDLGTFVSYTGVFPDAECDPRLASALLAYGEPLENDCGTGQGSPYDAIAGAGNYFNYEIIDQFHMAALALALTHDYADEAKALVEGLIARIARYRDPTSGESGQSSDNWERDIARFLLMSAALGYPLTSEEARLVQDVHLATVAEYTTFERWNLWADTVPDGTYSFRDGGMYPRHRPELIRIEDIALVLEYCWSPFRNPASAPFVDCDVVADLARWGAAAR